MFGIPQGSIHGPLVFWYSSYQSASQSHHGFIDTLTNSWDIIPDYPVITLSDNNSLMSSKFLLWNQHKLICILYTGNNLSVFFHEQPHILWLENIQPWLMVAHLSSVKVFDLNNLWIRRKFVKLWVAFWLEVKCLFAAFFFLFTDHSKVN